MKDISGLKLSDQVIDKSCTVGPNYGFQLKCLAISKAYRVYISRTDKYLLMMSVSGSEGSSRLVALFLRLFICPSASLNAMAA